MPGHLRDRPGGGPGKNNGLSDHYRRKPNRVKDYPIDFSHFNINGRVFGALGTEADYDHAEIFNVNLASEYGYDNKIKLDLPIVLPAVIKMNWVDYFGGAAMAGVTCMIGEDAREKDPELEIRDGKITSFPMLQKIYDSFHKYYRGSGQMVLSATSTTTSPAFRDSAGKYGFEALEFKFGQVPRDPAGQQDQELRRGREKGGVGHLVHRSLRPQGDGTQGKGCCPNFHTYGRLPMWTERPWRSGSRTEEGTKERLLQDGRLRLGRCKASSAWL